MKEKNSLIFLVDDDLVFLKSLEIEFVLNTRYRIESYSTGEDCIRQLYRMPDFVVLDYNLNDTGSNPLNGIDILDRIKNCNPYIHVVVLSSQDSIEVAIQCMRHMATDYVVKSPTAFIQLRKIIANMLEYRKIQKELKWYMDRS